MTDLSLERLDSSQTPKTRKTLLPKRWQTHVLLWFSVLFMGFPFFYAVLVSTQNNAEMFSLSLRPGTSFGANLEQVIERNIARALFNTAYVATMVTLGKALLSLFAGMAFVYFRFRGKWIALGFILMGLMVPGEVTIIALFRLVVLDFGWGNTYTALIVPAIASTTGTFLFRQHFSGISPELSEAAQLDGANPVQFLFQVLVPMSWNAMGALVVIMFIGAWNSYLWPLMIISNEEKQVIQVALAGLDQGVEVGRTFGPIMLGAVLASLPPILVFIFMQKQFLSGLAITQDK